MVFKYLKLAHFNMNTDELSEKEHFIKLGDFSKASARPKSEDSAYEGYDTNRSLKKRERSAEAEKSTPSIRNDVKNTTGMTFSSEV